MIKKSIMILLWGQVAVIDRAVHTASSSAVAAEWGPVLLTLNANPPGNDLRTGWHRRVHHLSGMHSVPGARP